jgi:hypothetical protein
MEKDKPLSPFRFAEYIRQGVLLSPGELRDFSPYLITKLYYYGGYEKMANLFNILWSLPKEFQYRMFCVLFAGVYPRGWIKSSKKKEPPVLEVEYLKKKYQVSTKVAREYLEMLSKEERKEIKKVFE